MLSKLLPNYKEIRAKLEPITFNEARRIHGPVYDAMVRELDEEGCPVAAKHFHCLAKKETLFYELGTILDRISDNFPLLLNIFENSKKAEMAAKLPSLENSIIMYKLFLEIVELLEPYEQFDWMLRDIYQIICDICETDVHSDYANKELIARILFKFGMYLSKKNELEISARYMHVALTLARPHMWDDELSEEQWNTLHRSIGRELVLMLLRYSKQKFTTNIKKAITIVKEAVLVLSEVSMLKDKLYCHAVVTLAKYFVEDLSFTNASNQLDKLDEVLLQWSDTESMEIKSHSYLLRGICLTNTGQFIRASKVLRQSSILARIYNMKAVQADVFLNLGKLYSTNPTQNAQALRAFSTATLLYDELGDVNGKLIAMYMRAKLKANDIFPFFMDVLKSSRDTYCNLHKLCQWKNCCKPFWLRMDNNEMKTDVIQCLLEPAEIIPVRRTSLFKW